MRIAKWDNVKFFLIYCVVFGHFAGALDVDSAFLKGLHLFIYAFHMPAFLFISGLFSKSSIQKRRYDRAATYLILYVFMKAFRFLVYSLVNGKSSSFHLMTEDGVPWFALVLFFYYILTMAISSWKREYVMIWAVVLGVLIGYDTQMGSFLAGMRLFTFYPFFLLGYYMPVDKLKDFLEQRRVRLASGVILAAALAICMLGSGKLYQWMGLLKGKSSYEALDLLPWGGACRGIYYVAAMILVLCVISLIPSVQCICTTWGKRSIQVYALHFPVMTVLNKTCHLESALRGVWPAHYALLVPAVSLVVTIILSLGVFEPFFTWMMNPFPRKN